MQLTGQSEVLSGNGCSPGCSSDAGIAGAQQAWSACGKQNCSVMHTETTPPAVLPRPAAQKLRSAGMLYQSDVETLWDLVQKLLLDADVEVGICLCNLCTQVLLGDWGRQ